MLRIYSILLVSLSLFSPVLFAKDFVVDTTQDSVDIKPGDGLCATQSGKCSLRASVMEANALEGADTVQVPGGEYRLTLGNTDEDEAREGDLDIIGDLTITGSGIGETTITGSNNNFRVFHVLVPATKVVPKVTLAKMGITQGLEDTNGGLVLNGGILTLNSVKVYAAGLNSSAINNNRANLSISKSVFSGNSRAIYSGNGRLAIKESTFEKNAVGNRGAAIYSNSDSLYIEESTFNTNKATRGSGGAIYTNYSAVYIGSSVFTNNVAGESDRLYSGGAITVAYGTATIENATFTNNVAYYYGGGLYAYSSYVTVSESTFEKNQTSRSGGAIFVDGGDFYLSKSTINDNKANNYAGGGIYKNSTQPLVIEGSTLTNNQAGTVGGGMVMNSGSEIRNTLIAGNTAKNGGGLYTSGDKSSVQNTTISGNSATASGGGIYREGRDNYRLDITSSTVAFNQASSGQAGNIFNKQGRIRLARSIVSNSKTGINCSGEVSSLGHNIDSDGTCAVETATDINNSDPLLEALADNGGNSPSHALAEDSPAINKIVVDVCPDVDQRYFYRKADNGNCDIGAFESGSVKAKSGTIAFSAGEYSVSEQGGTATLLINRSGGSEGQVSISFLDRMTGTAASNSDYGRLGTDTIYWGNGENNQRKLEIKISDDRQEEGFENVVVGLLRESGGAERGVFDSTSLTIIDDETRYGNMAFSVSTYSASETSGTVLITVERLNGSFGEASVSYATSNDTAKAGSDYTATRGVLTFANDKTTASFSVPILDDNVREGDESFILTLSDPSLGASLGSPATAKVIIAGNDNESTDTSDDNGNSDGSDSTDTGSGGGDDDSTGDNSTEDNSDSGQVQDDQTESSSESSGGGGGGGAFDLLMLILVLFGISKKAYSNVYRGWLKS